MARSVVRSRGVSTPWPWCADTASAFSRAAPSWTTTPANAARRSCARPTAPPARCLTRGSTDARSRPARPCAARTRKKPRGSLPEALAWVVGLRFVEAHDGRIRHAGSPAVDDRAEVLRAGRQPGIEAQADRAGAVTVMLPAFADPSAQLNSVKFAAPTGTAKPITRTV